MTNIVFLVPFAVRGNGVVKLTRTGYIAYRYIYISVSNFQTHICDCGHIAYLCGIILWATLYT